MRQLHTLALVADIHHIAGLDFALVDAERRQPANVGVHIDLEHVGDEVGPGVRGVDGARRRRFAFAGNEFRGIALQRTRHELGKHPHQLVQAGARVGRHEADRNEVAAPERPLEGIVELFQRYLFAFQVHHHEVVVQFDDLVDNLRMRFLDGREIGRRIGRLEEAVGHGRAAIGGEVDGQATPAERRDERRQHPSDVRVRRVDLVDDDEPAAVAVGGGLHHPLGEQFDPRLGADDDGGGLNRRQRPEGAAHEVGIARAVQKIDEAAAMFQVRGRCVQGVPQPFLVVGEIANRGAFFHGAGGADGARLLEQGFDQRRLAGPGMSDNGDVAYLFSPVRCGHGRSFGSCVKRKAQSIPQWFASRRSGRCATSAGAGYTCPAHRIGGSKGS